MNKFILFSENINGFCQEKMTQIDAKTNIEREIIIIIII